MKKWDKRKVMVIDQDEKLRHELCTLLVKLGFAESHLVCMENVSEANEFLEIGEKIDLIFLEVRGTQTEEPDGYSVCSFVEHTREHYGIPIILTFLDKLGPFRQASIYAQGFVEKPVILAELSKKVERFMKITELEERVESRVLSHMVGECCGRH